MSRTYTDPEVFQAALAGADWADPETDPTRIDWAARQAAAVIPFKVVDDRPVNPHGPTEVRYGRNELGHWGEQVCADALVFLTDTYGRRWLLLVERKDGHGWALPGGYVDPGEDRLHAAQRELREETGLCGVTEYDWTELPARYVPDPRASDEAWMVTAPARMHMGTFYPGFFPGTNADDDARRAEWIQADDYAELTKYLVSEYDGRVFPAHVALLRDALNGGGGR